MLKNDAWNGFEGRIWKLECNVRDFIQNNYTSYDGDESFLEGPTEHLCLTAVSKWQRKPAKCTATM